ncbi:MAG: hypothetical protein KBT30_00525, partial [Clostridiales bacterium]|nr:hypothetical protein [Candidatus Apopatousia equi]
TIKRKTSLILCLTLIVLTMFSFSYKLVYAEDLFLAPEYFSTTETSTNIIKVATVNQNSNIYNSVLVSPDFIEVESGKKILVLEETIISNENMSFVLYEDSEKQYFGYILKANYTTVSPQTVSGTFKTFYTGVKVYKFPTSSSAVLSVLENNIEVLVLDNCSNYIDYKNNTFYKIELNSQICYIKQSDLTNTNAFEPTKIEPTYNTQNNTIGMTAFIVMLICLITATIFGCIKIMKKKD